MSRVHPEWVAHRPSGPRPHAGWGNGTRRFPHRSIAARALPRRNRRRHPQAARSAVQSPRAAWADSGQGGIMFVLACWAYAAKDVKSVGSASQKVPHIGVAKHHQVIEMEDDFSKYVRRLLRRLDTQRAASAAGYCVHDDTFRPRPRQSASGRR